MNLFGAIYGILNNNASINGIVGNKIFDLVASQTSTAPFITVQQVTMKANNTKSGVSGTDEYTMKISMLAETQAQAKDLAEKVRTALDYYTGTVNGVTIQLAWYDSESPIWDDTSHLRGAENISQDYIFRVNR